MALRLSLVFVALCAFVLVCNAASVQKRDAEQSSVISDASQAIDKAFEDINKGIKKLSEDGIDFNKMLQTVNEKAKELTAQSQALMQDLGKKMEQAAKEQGLTS